MKNKEKYKEQIFEMACKGKHVALRRDGEMFCCHGIGCSDCEFHNAGDDCLDAFIEWCDKEYIEPCEFEKDELIEVSDDGKDWHLRYFSHKKNGKYYCVTNGLISKSSDITYEWHYCRKYGTLGGLAKESETIINQEHERILDGIREKANEYCKNVSCNMECDDCEHGAFVRAVVKSVEN